MTDKGTLVAVTVVGVDRPGIVAAISKVLYDAGCNLEDVSSTILRGHFSMMLLVHVPAGIHVADLERDLTGAGEPLGLMVTVSAVAATAAEVPHPTHMISVYGADRPGIVFKVAEALAGAGANITDLTSRVIGDADKPLYAVMLEVVLPTGVTAEQLMQLKDELDLEMSVHPVDADVL
jgi:glycine cleavage system transcriptional repressor